MGQGFAHLLCVTIIKLFYPYFIYAERISILHVFLENIFNICQITAYLYRLLILMASKALFLSYAANLQFIYYFIVNNKHHRMNKSYSEINSSAFTTRIKTDRMNTQTSQFHIASPISSHRLNPESTSYMKLAISKTHMSFNRGYLDLKRKQKQKRIAEEKMPKTVETNKFIVFKNLQEFQVNIQAEKGKIEQKQCIGKSYGVATFKGIHKCINTHQINIHIGQVTVLSLLQGYDGNLAALTLKKRYTQNVLEYFRKKKSSHRQQSFPIIEQSIKYSIEKAQKQLSELQSKAQDHSGTSLISLILHEGIIYAANCGSSSVYCNTISGKMIKLAVPHTTNNQSEVDRIVRAGGRLYQTIINLPFKKNMNVTGPLRIFPSGLTVTRTIGRSVDNSKQKAQRKPNKSMMGITNIPEIQYLPQSEAQWILISSSKIDQFVKQERMRDIIEQEMTKRSPAYEDSEVASHICKRLLLQAVESGAAESLTAVFILLNLEQRLPLPLAKNTQAKESPQQVKDDKKKQTPTLTHQPRSLTYIGKRKNFVEQIRIQ